MYVVIFAVLVRVPPFLLHCTILCLIYLQNSPSTIQAQYISLSLYTLAYSYRADILVYNVYAALLNDMGEDLLGTLFSICRLLNVQGAGATHI